jgi:hypothetical protein
MSESMTHENHKSHRSSNHQDFQQINVSQVQVHNAIESVIIVQIKTKKIHLRDYLYKLTSRIFRIISANHHDKQCNIRC